MTTSREFTAGQADGLSYWVNLVMKASAVAGANVLLMLAVNGAAVRISQIFKLIDEMPRNAVV